MKFTGELPGIRFDVTAMKAAIDQQCQRAIRGAAQAYLMEVLEIIPNWSGASRATFNKLAAQVGVDTDAHGGGVGAGEADSSGTLVLNDKGVYSFTYATTLSWLAWNEEHNANVDPDSGKWPPPAVLHEPGPYKSQYVGLLMGLHFIESIEFLDGVKFTAEPIKVA